MPHPKAAEFPTPPPPPDIEKPQQSAESRLIKLSRTTCGFDETTETEIGENTTGKELWGWGTSLLKIYKLVLCFYFRVLPVDANFIRNRICKR